MKNHDDLVSNEEQKNMKKSGNKTQPDNVYSLDIDESETLCSSDEHDACGDDCRNLPKIEIFMDLPS